MKFPFYTLHTGDSGAGKTEASNILVQQFMKLGRAETRALEEKILKVFIVIIAKQSVVLTPSVESQLYTLAYSTIG